MSTSHRQQIAEGLDPDAWLAQAAKPVGVDALRPQLARLASLGATQLTQLSYLVDAGVTTTQGSLSRWWKKHRDALREAGFDENDFQTISKLGTARLRKPQLVAVLKNMGSENQSRPAEIPAADCAGQAPRSGQPASVPAAPPKSTSAEKKGALKDMLHEMKQEAATGVKPRSLLPLKPGATGSDNSGA